MLKSLILILFMAILLSLACGLFFLLKPASGDNSLRLLTSLKFRITLTILLLVCLLYGFSTGDLISQAPW